MNLTPGNSTCVSRFGTINMSSRAASVTPRWYGKLPYQRCDIRHPNTSLHHWSEADRDSKCSVLDLNRAADSFGTHWCRWWCLRMQSIRCNNTSTKIIRMPPAGSPKKASAQTVSSPVNNCDVVSERWKRCTQKAPLLVDAVARKSSSKATKLHLCLREAPTGNHPRTYLSRPNTHFRGILFRRLLTGCQSKMCIYIIYSIYTQLQWLCSPQ